MNMTLTCPTPPHPLRKPGAPRVYIYVYFDLDAEKKTLEHWVLMALPYAGAAQGGPNTAGPGNCQGASREFWGFATNLLS